MMRRSIVVAGLLVFGLGAGLAWSWRLSLSPARRHLRLGLGYWQQQEWGRAVPEYQRALVLDPGLKLAYDLLAHYYLQAEHHHAALRTLYPLWALDPGYPHLNCRLAQAWWALGADRFARQLVDEELIRDAGCAAAHAVARQIEARRQLRARDPLRQREEELLVAYKMDPYHPDLLGQIAVVKLERGESGLATLFAGLALSQRPGDPVALDVLNRLRAAAQAGPGVR